MSDEYIGINIDADEKADWKQHVEDNKGEFESLTQLIIKSVQREMRGEHAEMVPPEEPKEVRADVDFTPIQERLDQMNDHISALTGEMRELELATDNSGENSDMMELMVAIHNTLPQVEDAGEFVSTQEELALPRRSARLSQGTWTTSLRHSALTIGRSRTPKLPEPPPDLLRSRTTSTLILAEGDRLYYEVK